MLVQDAMVKSIVACTPETDLAAVAGKMWEHDCGVIPVVDDHKRVIGMITDRDICIAVGTRNSCAASIQVGEVMSRQVVTIRADADVREAARLMREQKVRRLPVVDSTGVLQGIIRITEMTSLAADESDVSIGYSELVALLQSVMRREDPASVIN